MFFHAITIFLSAFLLFQVQPMIAKMILPWFGGTAAVWATCLLFFQATLLLGYGYAHGLVRRLPAARQWMLHAALLAVALFLLPVSPDEAWKPVDPSAPAWRILGLLAATIGLPYFLLSTTGPLIQAWYVQKHPGGIPYRLFALSNFGSMLALLSYPPLIEPNLTLRQQSFTWSAGFAVFALLCAYTGWHSRGAGAAPAGGSAPEQAPPAEAPAAPSSGLMGLWVALAAAATMLLMTVTSHMSMDVAPIPFLWVLPLALYLLTFIIAFDADGWYRRPVFLGLLPVALGIMCWLLMSDPTERPEMKFVLALFSLAFFLACMVCHGELARLKPHPAHLTIFYFMISLGGALGGVFVALIAPAAFNANYEFPIAIVFCAIVVTATLYSEKESPFRRELLGWPSIGVVTLASLITGVNARIVRDMVSGNMTVVRNFYGEMSVRQYGDPYEWDSYRTLVHGAINHGEQYTHPGRRREPAAYYCKDAGIALAVNARVPLAPPRKLPSSASAPAPSPPTPAPATSTASMKSIRSSKASPTSTSPTSRTPKRSPKSPSATPASASNAKPRRISTSSPSTPSPATPSPSTSSPSRRCASTSGTSSPTASSASTSPTAMWTSNPSSPAPPLNSAAAPGSSPLRTTTTAPATAPTGCCSPRAKNCSIPRNSV